MKKIFTLFSLAIILTGCEPQSEIQLTSDLSKIKLEASTAAFDVYSTTIDGKKYIIVKSVRYGVSVCPEIK